MTISTVISRNQYLGDGNSSIFSYTFRILENSDLKVTRTNTLGVETLLVLDTDYTVTGAGDEGGGAITLVAGNLTTGYTLSIRRIRPLTQETDIRNQGAGFREDIEDGFDSVVMQNQDQQDSIDRSLKLPESEVGTAANSTLPSKAARAGKVLGFDGDGNPIAVSI